MSEPSRVRAGPAPAASLATAPRIPRARSGRQAWRALLVLLLLPAVLGGCISDDEEKTIGDSIAARVNPQLALIDDPSLNAYVYEVGGRIAAVTGRPEIEYRFYLVNSGEVNAFALPGGHVYVTRGLIERTRTRAEFAGVLAHEIAHVAARHGVRKLQRQLRTGSVVSLLYEVVLGGEPELLKESSLDLARTAWSTRHSRRDEQEADRLAVEYLVRAGIEPDGVVTLLESFRREEIAGGTEAPADWFSTHPLTSSRIDAARRVIERLEAERGVVPPEGDPEAFSTFRALVADRSPAAGARSW